MSSKIEYEEARAALSNNPKIKTRLKNKTKKKKEATKEDFEKTRAELSSNPKIKSMIKPPPPKTSVKKKKLPKRNLDERTSDVYRVHFGEHKGDFKYYTEKETDINLSEEIDPSTLTKEIVRIKYQQDKEDIKNGKFMSLDYREFLMTDEDLKNLQNVVKKNGKTYRVFTSKTTDIMEFEEMTYDSDSDDSSSSNDSTTTETSSSEDENVISFDVIAERIQAVMNKNLNFSDEDLNILNRTNSWNKF